MLAAVFMLGFLSGLLAAFAIIVGAASGVVTHLSRAQDPDDDQEN